MDPTLTTIYGPDYLREHIARVPTADRPLLPLVVIGLPDELAVMDPEVRGNALVFDTTEQAHMALITAVGQHLPTLPQPGQGPAIIKPTPAGEWPVNVAYGPLAWGQAASGQPQLLPHTGVTLLLGYGLAEDDRERQVVDGVVLGEAGGNAALMMQALPLLGGYCAFDLAEPDPAMLRRLLVALERLVNVQ